jgi:hypothetical protein
MKRISAVLLLAALGLFLQPAAHADDAAAERTLASKLIDLTGGKDNMKAGFDAVIGNVIDNMQQHGMPQQGVDELKAAVDKWYSANINFEDVRPKMIDAYVAHFSADDLKAMLAFYQSPVGQKAIKNMPDVLRAGAMAEQDYTKSKIPSLNAELTPILVKYRDQMEPSGAGAAPTTGGGGDQGMPPAPAPGGDTGAPGAPAPMPPQ